MSQFQRTRSLNDGLSQAIDAFKFNFTKIARGMGSSYWAESQDEIANVCYQRPIHNLQLVYASISVLKIRFYRLNYPMTSIFPWKKLISGMRLRSEKGPEMWVHSYSVR